MSWFLMSLNMTQLQGEDHGSCPERFGKGCVWCCSMARAQEGWLGHGDSTDTEQGDAKVSHGTLHLDRDAKAQIQSCDELCSVGQGADTALSAKSWVQIPCAFQGDCVPHFHMCRPVGRDPSNRHNSLDYGASHLCCLTGVISVNVCNTKLMLGGSIH